MRWTKAYCFADRLQCAKFKHAVHARFVREITLGSNSLCFPVINYAFANLPSEDILLKLFVDTHCRWYVAGLDVCEEITDLDRLPKDFLIRVMHRYSYVIAEKITHKKLKGGDYQLSDGTGEK